jgi:hypothetical protein
MMTYYEPKHPPATLSCSRSQVGVVMRLIETMVGKKRLHELAHRHQ